MLFNQSFSGFFLPKYYYDADLISNCNHWNIIICHWIFLVCLHHQLFFQLRSPTNLFLIFTYFLLFFNIFHQYTCSSCVCILQAFREILTPLWCLFCLYTKMNHSNLLGVDFPNLECFSYWMIFHPHTHILH